MNTSTTRGQMHVMVVFHMSFGRNYGVCHEMQSDLHSLHFCWQRPSHSAGRHANTVASNFSSVSGSNHKLIMLIWNKEELPHQCKESIVVPIHKKGDKTDCSNYRDILLLSTSYKILSLGKFHMQTKLLGTTNVAFDILGQRLIRFSISVRY
jgi:hypothetical protein